MLAKFTLSDRRRRRRRRQSSSSSSSSTTIHFWHINQYVHQTIKVKFT